MTLKDIRKTCIKCGKSKDLTQFNKGINSTRDGFQPYCRACQSDYRKSYYQAHKNVEKQREFISKHGVGYIYKNFMLASQGFRCFICGKPLSWNDGDAVIDHDHQTGEIRAVICFGCNSRVGQHGDNIVDIALGIKKRGLTRSRWESLRYVHNSKVARGLLPYTETLP